MVNANNHVRLWYYDIQEHSDESVNNLDKLGYRLMEESGDFIERKVVQGIDSLILRTETDVESIGTTDEESTFLIIPIACVCRIIKTNSEKEIYMGGRIL